MIRHVVLTKFKHSVGEERIAAIYAELATLTGALSGANDFAGGRTESPEQMERGYTHAFMIDFESWSDLKTYADHPTHKALGSRLVQSSVGGTEGLLVLDIEI